MSEEKHFVSFICTSCRQEIEADASKVGQTVECPACGARLVVAPPEPFVVFPSKTASSILTVAFASAKIAPPPSSC